MNNANEPAFPKITTSYGTGTAYTERVGLTKREYFAALAMQGLCADPNTGDLEPKAIACGAVDLADALIAELEKQP